MITELGMEQETFQKKMNEHLAHFPIEDELKRVRSKAKERYLEIGLPTRKHENYRTIKLRQLYSMDYELSNASTCQVDASLLASHVLPECKESHIVFVNGCFSPSLSNCQALPSNIVLISLKEAMLSFGALLSNHWNRFQKEEQDPFAYLNLILHHDGAFLYVPPKTIVEKPIQILHLIDVKDKPLLLLPRMHVYVGNHAQCNFVQVQSAVSNEAYFFNQAFEIDLGEGARTSYQHFAFKEPKQSFHFNYLRANLKKNAWFQTVSIADGSLGVRNDYRVSLCGENAEVLLNGLSVLHGKKEVHTNIMIDHQMPYCRSHQLFKSVLYDSSRSGFEGKIMVRQLAQKTEAFQLNNTLLMSDQAQVDSKPNLEIFADDVKASHGATVGQLDADQLFYMRSRGFSEAQAKQILVNGFCREILDLIQIPSLEQLLMSHLQAPKETHDTSVSL